MQYMHLTRFNPRLIFLKAFSTVCALTLLCYAMQGFSLHARVSPFTTVTLLWIRCGVGGYGVSSPPLQSVVLLKSADCAQR